MQAEERQGVGQEMDMAEIGEAVWNRLLTSRPKNATEFLYSGETVAE